MERKTKEAEQRGSERTVGQQDRMGTLLGWATCGGFRARATQMEEANFKSSQIQFENSQISIHGNKSGTRRCLSGAVQVLGCGLWDPSVAPRVLTRSVHPGRTPPPLEEGLKVRGCLCAHEAIFLFDHICK